MHSDEDRIVVSVICLTFNHEKFISKALSSIIEQETNFRFEIIVHDDASTDDTKKIIEQYYLNYPELIVTIFQEFNQRSKGGNVFKNAYDQSRGEYIAICEGDDYWDDPSKLQKQVNFLQKNPDYVITYSNCRPIFEKNIKKRELIATTKDLSAKELQEAPPIHTLSVCFRKVIQIPEELGFVQYGDMFLWALLGFYGKGKYLSSFRPPCYRVHYGGVHSMQSIARQYDATILTFSLMMRFFYRSENLRLTIIYRKKIIIESIKYLIKKIPGFIFFINFYKILLRGFIF